MLTATETPNPAAADLKTSILIRHVRDRMAADGRLVNRDLSAPDLPDAPAGLAKAIQVHTAAVAEFTARRDAIDAATASLADALDDPEISGARLAGQVEALRCERFDVARLHVDLLLAKRPILEDLAEHLERGVRLNIAMVEKVRERGRKDLLKAGYQPPAAVTAPGVNPEIEEHQMMQAINRTAPVREAQAAVETVKVALDLARHQAAAVDHDAALVRERVLTAWRMIVGKIA